MLPPRTTELISFLNCGTFVKFLADITGMERLTSDPFLHGGGMHETFPGGYLKMHTDFNFHKVLRLDRRINAILYLNEGWRPEWRGELVLSGRDMKNPVVVPPLMNRMVVFNTNDHSFHGQPDPHTFPVGSSRKSIAMYYYSNGRPENEITSRKIGTSYRLRHFGDFPITERIRDVGRTLLGRKKPK
jgi:Rps23 Pro-64 3,4-dihydroxylase Tpa1-like proline 4-hydroxylase